MDFSVHTSPFPFLSDFLLKKKKKIVWQVELFLWNLKEKEGYFVGKRKTWLGIQEQVMID